MSNFVLTLVLAFSFVALALFAIGIGWLLTGKPFERRSCGGDPLKKQDDSCGNKSSCNLCGGSDQPSNEEESKL